MVVMWRLWEKQGRCRWAQSTERNKFDAIISFGECIAVYIPP
jgi:hypothetical protein